MQLRRLMVLTAVLTAWAGSAHAATFTVNRYDDPTTAGCPSVCSLRAAVSVATDGETVVLPAGTYTLDPSMGTIGLNHGVTISGSGASTTTITLQPGASAGGLIVSNPAQPATISGVTLTGAKSLAVNAVGGSLLLDHVVVRDNRRVGGGGSINVSSGGAVTIDDSTISGNVSDATPLSNPTSVFGGGITATGVLVMRRDTVSGNSVITTGDNTAAGGGIYVGDNSTASTDLHDVTITANSVTSSSGTASGGGIYLEGKASLTNVTVAGNGAFGSTVQGGNLARVASATTGARTIANSIITAPTGGSNCSFNGVGATITSGGSNLQGTADCQLAGVGDRTASADLGPLADNGGPVLTMMPSATSYAIDAGNNALCSATDARGIPRPLGPRCDIGAVERQPAPAVTTGDTAPSASETDATVGGTVNAFGLSGTVTVEFGTTTAYGQQSAAQAAPAGFTATAVSASLVGLTAATTYHYRVVATTSAGSTQGPDATFTTATPAPAPPASGTPLTPSAPVVPPAVTPNVVSPAKCVVPNLKNLTLTAATKALKTAHCAIGKVTKPKHGTKLVVIKQGLKAKSVAAVGTKVKVTLGPKPKSTSKAKKTTKG